MHKQNATIQYIPEGYTITGPKLMGRNAAGHAFLKAWFQYGQVDHFSAWVPNEAAAKAFAEQAQAFGARQPTQTLGNKQLDKLGTTGVLYTPGPGISDHAWERTQFNPRAWSLCGITHTTSSDRTMNELAQWLTAPVEPWDAIICTSTAVRDTVREVWEQRMRYLQGRLGATRFVLPQLPVIPLGVHTEEFEFTPEQRLKARQDIGAHANTVVVLFAGRLSFHAKAHPLAMYQALEQALEKALEGLPKGSDVMLVECGWHANEFIAQSFQTAAQLICPNIRTCLLDGRTQDGRTTAWASADIFCSLTDNIQETFGLTPIEAMATGLPCVITDWNGYKDTVRDGIDGYRIPTRMMSAGAGEVFATAHALGTLNYDQYIGQTAMTTVVDIAAASQALGALIRDKALRHTLGAQGKARVNSLFTWRTVIAQYQDLWARLSEDRRSLATVHRASQRNDWPAAHDPMLAFKGYATQHYSPELQVNLARPDALSWYKTCTSLGMVNFSKHWVASETLCQSLIEQVQAQPLITCRQLANILRLNTSQTESLQRTLMFLSKLGVFTLTAQKSSLT